MGIVVDIVAVALIVVQVDRLAALLLLARIARTVLMEKESTNPAVH